MTGKSDLCIATAKWGKEGLKNVKNYHECKRTKTARSRLCGTHEKVLVNALTSSSGFYRRRIMREHFSNLTNEDIQEVEKAWGLTPEIIKGGHQLSILTSIIRLNEPIGIVELTHKTNDFFGYKWSKKQLAKYVAPLVREGVVTKQITSRRDLTNQGQEVIYSLSK